MSANTLHRRTYGAAGRRELAYLFTRQEPLPLSAAEQFQSLEYAVPMMAAQRVFQQLRPDKRTRHIYETEEREAAYAHVQEVTPSDWRERGK